MNPWLRFFEVSLQFHPHVSEIGVLTSEQAWLVTRVGPPGRPFLRQT